MMCVEAVCEIINNNMCTIWFFCVFAQVGRGNAHDEHIHFSVRNGRMFYGDEESAIRGGKVRVEFIKGYRDNPKINAIVLFSGDVENVPRLPPLDAGDWIDAEETAQQPQVSINEPPSKQQQQRNRRQQQKQQQADSGSHHQTDDDGGFDDEFERPAAQGGSAARKTSGPKQEDPYALDDSSVMLPVFIAIGAFIPLLFCLCKL